MFIFSKFFHKMSNKISRCSILMIILLFIEKVITRPLLTLTQAFDQLSKQNYNYSLPAPVNDEVGQVIVEFKKMRNHVHGHQIEMDRLYQSEKIMLEEIRQSEQHLLLYREQSPIATLEWDVNGMIIDWNKTAEKIFGYSANEAYGMSFTDFLFGQKTIKSQMELWNGLLRQPAIIVSIQENRTKDGNIISCEWHNTVLKDNSGEAIGLASLVLDVTERKQAEEKLQLSARVFKEAHEGIMITDSERIITDVNPMFCQITGYAPEDVIGKNPNSLSSGRQNSTFYEDMWKALKEALNKPHPNHNWYAS